MQVHRGSLSSVNLPKLQPLSPQANLSSLSMSKHSTFQGGQSLRTLEATGIDSPRFTSPTNTLSAMAYIQKQKETWKNKFKLLEVRSEVNYKNNSARNTLQCMSPSLISKDQLKDSISNWGKDQGGFNSPIQSPYAKGMEEFTSFTQKEKQRIEDEKQENGLIEKINESFDEPQEDTQVKPLIGDKAPEHYFRHYKKLDKVSQQNRYFELQDSTFTSVLQASQKQMVTPCKVGLIKQKGGEEDLIIPNMKYGDSYAKVISEGMRRVSNIQNFYMSGNRITKNGADELLKAISKKARVLELAENQIGNIGCQHISQALSDRETKIEILNLEGNKLGDAAVALILSALTQNKVLTLLNLSKNFLTDKSAEKIASIVDTNYYLKELYLHWNQIKSQGGAALFTALSENESLKVFDISCNSLGSDKSCADQVSSFLLTNVELRHLDLSNNYFKFQASAKIAESLIKNKTIYGFHFSGNAGYVDSRGFLIVKEDQNEDLTGIHVKQRINGCKVLGKNAHRNLRDTDMQDCCWICEGWGEETLTWVQDKSGDGSTDPLFVHFNFEDYKANYHGKGQDGSFPYKRMFPPGHLYYFYTCDEVQNFDKSDPTRVVPNPEGSKISDAKLFDGRLADAEIESVNMIDIKRNEAILDENYQPIFSVLPRTADPEYIPAKKKKQRVKWTFPISIFAKWRPDDEEILKKCFDIDWENCKIPQKIKKQDDQDQVKEFLRSKYKHIKEAYKHFASIAPIQDIWCIQNGPWLELISIMNILDAKVKDADINLKWTATISGGDKGNQRNPERGINRHQLMEALVRIAEEKYILKYAKVNTFFESIKLLWEEHLEMIFVEKYNQQKWRSEVYWVEDVDMCLKNYRKIIEHIYKKFAKQKVKPGQIPFMCLDELLRIVQLAGLTEDEHFGSGVSYQAFNFAMMTQIDELQSDRIFQMSLLEFYEALTRIAEGAALPVGPGIVADDFEWTWEKRVEQPLAHKLEGLIIKLFDTICDASFKATIPKIEKSYFVKIDDSEEYE